MSKKKLDIKLQRKEELGDLYDINILNGDIETTATFDTNLQVSLLAERRADPSEVAIPEKRRGWFGNELSEIVGFEIGSKLWLLEQARRTQTTLNLAINYAIESLQWMIEDNLIENFEVSGEFSGNFGIILTIRLQITPSETETRFLQLWRNTQVFEDKRSL
jgi:phage gp46-like protein